VETDIYVILEERKKYMV